MSVRPIFDRSEVKAMSLSLTFYHSQLFFININSKFVYKYNDGNKPQREHNEFGRAG